MTAEITQEEQEVLEAYRKADADTKGQARRVLYLDDIRPATAIPFTRQESRQ